MANVIGGQEGVDINNKKTGAQYFQKEEGKLNIVTAITSEFEQQVQEKRVVELKREEMQEIGGSGIFGKIASAVKSTVSKAVSTVKSWVSSKSSSSRSSYSSSSASHSSYTSSNSSSSRSTSSGGGILGSIGRAIGGTIGAIGGAIIGASSGGIRGAISGAVSGARTGSSFGGAIGGAISGAIGGTSGSMGISHTGFGTSSASRSSAGTNLFGTLANGVSNIFNSIGNTFNSIAASTGSPAARTISNLASGIGAVTGAIGYAAQNGIGFNALKSAGLFGSPSSPVYCAADAISNITGMSPRLAQVALNITDFVLGNTDTSGGNSLAAIQHVLGDNYEGYQGVLLEQGLESGDGVVLYVGSRAGEDPNHVVTVGTNADGQYVLLRQP